jgi:hypothetical protein
MKPSLILAIAGLLVIALIAVPSLADNQAAIANQIGGSQNTQTTTNNEYNTLANQNTGAVQTGSGNTQTTTSTVIVNNGGTVGTGTGAINEQSVSITLPSGDPYDNQLALENTGAYLTTIYSTRPLAEDIGILAAGDIAVINYSAGAPLLPEVIATSDVPRALNDATTIPTYDPVNQKFDHGSLTVYPLEAMASFNGGLSRNNEIQFIAPKLGDYTLILDPRPGISVNIEPAYPSGQQPQISGSMVDITLYNPVIMPCKTEGTCPVQSGQNIIGTNSPYPIDPVTGRAET